DVMGCPSDQTARGLIRNLTRCGGPTSNVGSPLSTAAGRYWSPIRSKTLGSVWFRIMSLPHDELPQGAYQSAQAGSCDAPSTSVPPFVNVSVFAVWPTLEGADPAHAVVTSDTT